MATPRIRFPVGTQRITSRTNQSEARATKDVRAQMAEVQRRFSNLVKAVPGVTEVAIFHALEPIYDQSQIFVPVDTGKLKESGFIRTSSRRDGAAGVVGYGAAGNPFYAVYVHERLDLKHDAPTQAKYLEEAVKEKFSEFESRLADSMKRSLGFGR